MILAESDAMVTMPSPVQQLGDEGMVGRERWTEIRRLFYEERRSISAVARRLDLDRKTVRRCIRSQGWAVAVGAPFSPYSPLRSLSPPLAFTLSCPAPARRAGSAAPARCRVPAPFLRHRSRCP